MKAKISIILIISIFLLSGCTNINNGQKNTDLSNSKTDSIQERLAIYQIDSDTFDRLLESNSFTSIESVAVKYYSYPKDGNNYITYDALRLEITDDFINNTTALEKHLADNGIYDTVEHAIIFEAPHTPISIWIKTDVNTHFITVNEDFEDNSIYKLYSQSDYIKKYKSQELLLTINNNPTSSNKTVKAYYKHAQLPLLEILSSCNAKIKWKNEKQVNITIDKTNYLLDVKNNSLYKKHDKKNNILYECNGGGPYNMYFSDKEYYVDSDTLQYVMLKLGQKINIEYNTEQKIVNIITN